MKTIGFIGAFDKTDLIIYIAKIMIMLKKKVLVVDSARTQKTKYMIPAINPTTTYITEYEDIDVAVGFQNLENIKKYLATTETEEMDYDYMLVDVDSAERFREFKMSTAFKNFFVTSFDIYCVKKGLEIVSDLYDSIKLTKVLFSKDMLREENEYLDYVSSEYKIRWNDYKICFPYETADLTANMENQRVMKIKFKKLSLQYRECLLDLIDEIVDDVSTNEVRKMFRNAEKEF